MLLYSGSFGNLSYKISGSVGKFLFVTVPAVVRAYL